MFGWGNEGGQFAGMWYNLRETGVFRWSSATASRLTRRITFRAGVWHYVVLTKTVGAANLTTKIYIDGVDEGAMNGSSTSATISIADGRMQIGRWGSGNYSNSAFDEVRVSNTARPAGWIATEYNNQNAPAAFLAVGPQESQSGGGAVAVTVASAPAGLSLTVDGAACTTPCALQWIAGSNHTTRRSRRREARARSMSSGAGRTAERRRTRSAGRGRRRRIRRRSRRSIC